MEIYIFWLVIIVFFIVLLYLGFAKKYSGVFLILIGTVLFLIFSHRTGNSEFTPAQRGLLIFTLTGVLITVIQIIKKKRKNQE